MSCEHIRGRLGIVMASVLALLTGCAAPNSVYLGAADKNLYALLGRDGTLRWKNALGGEVHTTPYYWAGNVIVAASDGVVYAFDADSAKPLWQTPLMTPQQAAALAPQSVLSTPVMPVNARIYVGTGLGDVFEILASSGAKTLRASLGVAGRQWLTASQDGTQVFVASNAGSGTVYSVKVTGGIRWQQQVSLPTGPTAEGPNGGLVVPTQAGLVLLDFAHGGQIVTTYTAAGLIEGVASDMTFGLDYVVTSTGEVQELVLQPGSPPGYNHAWVAQPSNAAGYAPVLSGFLYVTCVNGNAAAITPNSGGVGWSLGIDTDLAASPAYGRIDARNTPAIVVASSSGHVYALNPNTGVTIWKQTSVIGGRVDAAALVQ